LASRQPFLWLPVWFQMMRRRAAAVAASGPEADSTAEARASLTWGAAGLTQVASVLRDAVMDIGPSQAGRWRAPLCAGVPIAVLPMAPQRSEQQPRARRPTAITTMAITTVTMTTTASGFAGLSIDPAFRVGAVPSSAETKATQDASWKHPDNDSPRSDLWRCPTATWPP